MSVQFNEPAAGAEIAAETDDVITLECGNSQGNRVFPRASPDLADNFLICWQILKIQSYLKPALNAEKHHMIVVTRATFV